MHTIISRHQVSLYLSIAVAFGWAVRTPAAVDITRAWSVPVQIPAFYSPTVPLVLDPANDIIVISFLDHWDWRVEKYSHVDGNQLWSTALNQYNGELALAVDAAGNVIASGMDSESNRVIVKLDGNDGNGIWTNSLAASAIAVDGAGNVIANVLEAGSSQVVVKLDGNGGHGVWTNVFSASTNRCAAMVLDGAGNVIVAGLDADWSPITVKLDATDGQGIWTNQFLASAMAVDTAGNVISSGRDTDWNLMTVKFDGVDGHGIWTNHFETTAIALDSGGDVIALPSYGTNTFTVKLNGTDGHGIWTNRFVAGAIVVDNANNIVATGYGEDGSPATAKFATDGSPVWEIGGNGSALAVDTAGAVYLLTGLASGGELIKYVETERIDPVWVALYDGPCAGNDYLYAMALDAAGNVFVTGQSDSCGSSTDYAIAKYNSGGELLWEARYHGPAGGYDGAYALTVDASGHVYVTGGSDNADGNSDYATLKYSPNGQLLWEARYDGPSAGSESAYALAVDSVGNVYVTGQSDGFGTGADIATLKYDSTGQLRWAARYDGPSRGYDYGYTLAVDGAGNVYVTGQSSDPGGPDDFVTLKYDPEGQLVWGSRYDGPTSGYDYAYALAVDSDGSVYVTGQSDGSGAGADAVTLKYDSEGELLWEARYDGPSSGYDYAYALALDNDGNVVVTGGSTGLTSPSDYVTIKYDPNGELLWEARYDGPSSGGDYAYALKVDSTGNVFVTGDSFESGATDYATVKYSPEGEFLWAARYDGPSSGQDFAYALALDAAGNLYVTGTSQDSGGVSNFATVKYAAVASSSPTISSLAPNSTSAGGPGFVLTVNGNGFASGATVMWNGVERSTIFVNSGQLTAEISAEDIATTSDILIALVAVSNADGGVAPGKTFTIVGGQVEAAESVVVAVGETLAVAVPPVEEGAAGVAASVNNAGLPDELIMTVATYATNPTPATVFDAGGGFVDLQILGADAGDSALAHFFYPSTVTGESEEALVLLYFDGLLWISVRSSGDTDPSKDTTDNLDGTVSGGRFTVIFDDTSSPRIDELDGTVFLLADTRPQIHGLTGPIEPMPVNATASFTLTYSAINNPESHHVTFVWGDGTSTEALPEMNGTVTLLHSYSSPGVYSVAATITDSTGSSAMAHFEYSVVYDPNGGFVTGGGWINSPPEAYRPNPSLTGKATFGFNSKYKTGATVPTGQTEFQFKVADLRFHSETYEWLVVAGAKAQFKGEGTINGAGIYRFMLTAIDGQINGGGGVDKFRMRIWDKVDGGLIYDNQLNAPDNADPTTALQGGSIVVHRQD